jgi:hypothetical protein
MVAQRKSEHLRLLCLEVSEWCAAFHLEPGMSEAVGPEAGWYVYEPDMEDRQADAVQY